MADEEVTRRLSELEIRSAHQDRVIEELSEALHRQWHEIDRLRQMVERIAEHLRQVAEERANPPADRKPPHY